MRQLEFNINDNAYVIMTSDNAGKGAWRIFKTKIYSIQITRDPVIYNDTKYDYMFKSLEELIEFISLNEPIIPTIY
jgi:hypothetical protein